MYETKIFTCGISNIFLKYREKLGIDNAIVYDMVTRVLNVLLWQKYEYDS